MEHGLFQRTAEGMSAPLRVSVGVPVYNEELVAPQLVRRITSVLDQIEGGPHEVVFVDDGSTDRTADLLADAAYRDSRLTVISLSRNFGHQIALGAALDQVSGDVTIMLDGDLQDPPEAIPIFLDCYRKGYDVVYARRVNRKESWWLRACYYIFYRLVAALAGMHLPLDSGDFGLMSRRVVEEIRRMPEHHRYLRGLRTWVGFRQIGVPIERSARHAGRTKYTPLKLLKLASDGIFAFSIVPLRAAALLGTMAVVLSALFAGYSLYAKLFLNRSPQGFTALILIITFLSGVNLFFLGIIGEYVGRVYEESKSRPHYVIAKVIGRSRSQMHEATVRGVTLEAPESRTMAIGAD
jgi:polyisoprenyl-phosphate glycosyltransferase